MRLEKFYSSKSRAHAIQVREELQTFKKGAVTIADYILRIKLLLGKLVAIDCSFMEEQKVIIILKGLDV